MRILELLNDRSKKKLISYNGITLTKNDFALYVDSIYRKMRKNERLKTDNFIMLKVENPIDFYALAFALWRNKNKVLFPNREYLNYGSTFVFYEYALCLKNGEIIIEKNEAFKHIDLPKGSDAVIFSSGSTGSPKGITHNSNHFLTNAVSVNKKIGYKQYASVTPLKPYLVSAFSHFLVHFLSDSHLIFVDYEEVERIKDFYKAAPAMAFVGSPMHIVSSVQFIGEDAKPLFFYSSGDFMYPNNIRKVVKRFPASVFFNVYGLAEIAGRFFMNKIDRHTGYAHYSSIGENIGGTECRIINNQVYLSSAFKFFGYITNSRFIPSKSKHPTGDLVQQEGGITSLYGRANDEIKIGGNKISLKHIEKKISGILKDDICILFDMRHPALGTLFALALQTKNKYKRSALIERLRKHLRPYEIPHMFYYISKIPYTQTVKIDRNRIKDKAKDLVPIM